MYPQEKLSELAAYKAALRSKIAQRRDQWGAPAVVVARPLMWVDRMQDLARRMSPWIKYGAVPLGFLLRRRLFAPLRVLGPVLRWSPLIFSAVRGIAAASGRGAAGGASSTAAPGRRGQGTVGSTTPHVRRWSEGVVSPQRKSP